jgi:hypothetical protein
MGLIQLSEGREGILQAVWDTGIGASFALADGGAGRTVVDEEVRISPIEQCETHDGGWLLLRAYSLLTKTPDIFCRVVAGSWGSGLVQTHSSV